MKTCLFTGIFRDEPIEEVIKVARKIGYDAVEIRVLSHLPLRTSLKRVKEIRKLVRGEKIKIAGLYTETGAYTRLADGECQKQFDEFRWYVNMAKEIGASFVVHHPGGPTPKETGEKDFQKATKWMKRAANYAREVGIKVVMEIHMDELVETAESALRLLGLINQRNIGLIYDAGNMYVSNTEYGERVIEMLGEKIFHFHVKDVKKIKDKRNISSYHEFRNEYFCFTLLEEGEVEHLSLFRALKKTGYEGYLSCECLKKIDPYFKAKHEYEKVREMLGKL